MAHSRCPKVEPQVPPLRYAPVGMTNFRAVAHLGMSGGGWTAPLEQPTRFRLPAYSLRHSRGDRRVLIQDQETRVRFGPTACTGRRGAQDVWSWANYKIAASEPSPWMRQ